MIAIPNSILVWYLTEHGLFSAISVFYNFFVLTVILVYFIFFTYRNDGQTIGKMIMNIQVVGWKEQLDLRMIVLRYGLLFGLIQFDNIYRLVTGMPLSLLGVGLQALAILLVLSLLLIDDKRRGVHDLIAGTWVVGEVKG